MTNPYLDGNYAPVLVERTHGAPLRVEGVAPPDLDGRLLRNGPNPAVLPADDSDYHWFTGDGMVHAIDFRDGTPVAYRNRWVRTRKLAAELGTPVPHGPQEPIDGPANTHVISHGGRLLALAESGLPHALSGDLERARIHDFDGALASPMAAHPKVDPDTGELVFFGTDVFGPPFLRTHVVDSAGTLVSTRPLDVPRATMMHDFGVTASRLVLLDLPVVFDLELLAAGRPLPYRWMPEDGARVGVADRHGDDPAVTWCTIDPMFAFHVLNAYDDGEVAVVDVVRYDAAVDTAPGGAVASSLPALARWRIDPLAGTVSEARIDDTPVELPRIDDTLAGRRHRYGYCVELSTETPVAGPRGLVRYDFDRDTSVRFDPGPDRQCGEPIFVRAHDGRADDEGWVLSVAYDRTTDSSVVLVLDATAFAGPPVATIHLPARVPFGFHGSWVPATGPGR